MSIDISETSNAFATELSIPLDRQVDVTVEIIDKIFYGLFNNVYEVLSSNSDEATVHRSLDELFRALNERKFNSPPAEWQRCIEQFRSHRLMKLLHEDPFTYRAFSKPRGYAGDAVMMDYIYGQEEMWPLPEASPIGRQIFNFTTRAPASEGVRSRRAYVAAKIDRLAEEKRYPHILAIASGHLREVNLSAAVRRRKTGRLVALDADPLSLKEVRESYSCFGVETCQASFRELIGNRNLEGKFDFVYSTGLFDYLNQRIARRLVSGMFNALRPGGSLLVANFLQGVRDIGYMETFMDWNLVYRSRSEMVDLTMGIPEEQVKEVSVHSEEHRNIVFMQLTKN